jgi:hypothetical protein
MAVFGCDRRLMRIGVRFLRLQASASCRCLFIDYSTGGSIDGAIHAADANLAATTDRTIIIPGHGHPVSNRSQLKDFRDMLVAIRDNVAKLKKQGRSLGETIAARPTATYDAKWGQFLIESAFFTQLVYQGV